MYSRGREGADSRMEKNLSALYTPGGGRWVLIANYIKNYKNQTPNIKTAGQ